MFDIGFPELFLVAIVGLLVLGPERLPAALRTLGLWFGRAQRSFHSIKTQIEEEVGMDEVHRQLRRELMEEKIKLHQASIPADAALEPEIAERQERAAAAKARAEALAAAETTTESPSPVMLAVDAARGDAVPQKAAPTDVARQA